MRPSPGEHQSLDVRRYRITDILGEGGFGRVYRARLEGPEGFTKDVAVKLLTIVDPSPDDLQRFRDEARILGLIRDRNIVNVDPPTRLGGKWAVVMEFVDGASCEYLVVKHGPLPLGVVLEIVEEVARTLDNLWKHPGENGAPLQLLHRDIKPSNIQITPTGQVKILDFGIARAAFGAREAHTTAHIGGTKGYIAPERLEGDESPKGDIFSLGMVMHKLVTGQLPKMGSPIDPRLTKGGERIKLEVLKLAERMRSPKPDDRPTARQVESMCRMLRGTTGDADLREWASKFVPNTVSLGNDALIGKTLTETLSGIPRMPRGVPVDLRPLAAEAIAPASESRVAPPGPRPVPPSLVVLVGLAGFLMVGSFVALGLTLMVYLDPSLIGREASDLPGMPSSLSDVLADDGRSGSFPDAEPLRSLADELGTRTPDNAVDTGKVIVERDEATPPKPAPAPRPQPGVAAPRPQQTSVSPAPSVATPRPQPAPAPVVVPVASPTASAPVAPTSATGTVKMASGAQALHLVKDGRIFPPGNVPVGTYTLMATFADVGRVEAGKATVREGVTISIRCNATSHVCSPL